MSRENQILRVAVILGEMGTGGIERVVMNYYCHMDKSKVQFDVYVHENSKNPQKELIERLGGRLVLIPAYTHIFQYCRELENYFKKNRYTIVHIHLNTMSVFAQYAAWKAGVPVRITHSHSTAGKGEFKRNVAKYTLRLLSNIYPTHRCACTMHAGEWLFGKKHSAEIKIWKNAIEVDRYVFSEEKRKSVRSHFGVSDDVILLGHVGRFMPQKNHSFLVDIFAEFIQLEPNTKLMLVGDGKEEKFIKAIVEERGLSDSVIFAGSYEEVSAFYQAFDVFILPSLYEGLGMVAIEAQVSGLPVLVSDAVPDDVLITDCVEMIALKKTAKEWAEKTEEHRNKVKRIDHTEEIRNAGYDIQTAANNLTEWYLELNQAVLQDRGGNSVGSILCAVSVAAAEREVVAA